MQLLNCKKTKDDELKMEDANTVNEWAIANEYIAKNEKLIAADSKKIAKAEKSRAKVRESLSKKELELAKIREELAEKTKKLIEKKVKNAKTLKLSDEVLNRERDFAAYNEKLFTNPFSILRKERAP